MQLTHDDEHHVGRAAAMHWLELVGSVYNRQHQLASPHLIHRCCYNCASTLSMVMQGAARRASTVLRWSGSRGRRTAGTSPATSYSAPRCSGCPSPPLRSAAQRLSSATFECNMFCLCLSLQPGIASVALSLRYNACYN